MKEECAKSKTCDFVDVEYYTYENSRDVVSALKRLGQNVICSHHEFEETPQDDTTFTLLEEMECSECDVVKMAVMHIPPPMLQDLWELVSLL